MRMLVGVVVVAAVCAVASAQPAEREPARARLVSEHDVLVPGKTAWLGVTFEIEPEWHLYSNGQSDTGAPIELKFELPAGFKAGELVWPAPKRHISPGDLLDHVYEKRVTLMLPVEVPADAKPGSTAGFSAEGSWLVCRSVCLMGSATVSLNVPIAKPGQEPKPSKDAPLFTEARARVAKPLPLKDPPVQLRWKGDELEIEADGARSLAFYPGADCGKMADLIRNGQAKGGTLTLVPEAPAQQPRIQGVLEISRQSGGEPIVYLIDTRPVNPPPSQPSNQPTPRGG